jgi:hypothetical protein
MSSSSSKYEIRSPWVSAPSDTSGHQARLAATSDRNLIAVGSTFDEDSYTFLTRNDLTSMARDIENGSLPLPQA